MNRMMAGLLGTVAGLATMGVAQAAIPPAPSASEALQVSSYADLLAPVPNAVDLVKLDDAARARRPAAEGELQLAQYYGPPPAYHHHHHHHHHHHAYYRHHHHHHHHHNTFVGIPGVGGVVVGNR